MKLSVHAESHCYLIKNLRYENLETRSSSQALKTKNNLKKLLNCFKSNAIHPNNRYLFASSKQMFLFFYFYVTN